MTDCSNQNAEFGVIAQSIIILKRILIPFEGKRDNDNLPHRLKIVGHFTVPISYVKIKSLESSVDINLILFISFDLLRVVRVEEEEDLLKPCPNAAVEH